MGDCYFLSNYTNYRGEILKDLTKNRKDSVIRSEDVGAILMENGSGYLSDLKLRRKLQHMINGNYGIYFYESDLWNKEHLRQQLYKLIDEALEKYSAEPL